MNCAIDWTRMFPRSTLQNPPERTTWSSANVDCFVDQEATVFSQNVTVTWANNFGPPWSELTIHILLTNFIESRALSPNTKLEDPQVVSGSSLICRTPALIFSAQTHQDLQTENFRVYQRNYTNLSTSEPFNPKYAFCLTYTNTIFPLGNR